MRNIVGALLVGVVVASGASAASPASAAPSGAISGQVFRDYNGNGVFDATAVANGPREMGLEQVVVRAFDARDRVVGETVTALGSVTDPGGAWSTRGSYTLALDATVEAGDALRVEFIADGYHDTFSGTPLQSNASVRFLSAPAADLTGVDFGVSTPEDYSTSAPPLVSAIQSAGDPASLSTGEPAVVAQYWNSYYTSHTGQNSSGTGTTANAAGVATSGQFPKRTTLATFGQVGSVWGTAYQTSLRNVYAAASYKRLSGLGPLGIGGIYRIPVTETTLDGQRTVAPAGAAPQAWLSVQGQSIANVPGATVDVGLAQSNAARGLGAPDAWVADAHAFAHAGKVGIGSITVSADQRWLYFINLFDRNLYRIDISDPAAAAAAPHIERIDLSLSAGQRPWAVTEHHGRVYVGYVDAGTPWQTAAWLDSGAYVVSAPVDQVDAAADGAAISWNTELTIDLGYQKGPSYNAGADTEFERAPWLWRWNSWVDEWSNPTPGGLGQEQPTGVGYYAQNSWGYVQTYPQAVLSDIEFSDTNDLIVGLMDRTSLQAGNRNRSADTSAPATGYEAISSGDTLIAARDADGTYVLESDGRLIDGRTSDNGAANEGVDGQEFFNDINNLPPGGNLFHPESTLGGIAAKTGYNGIVSAVIDPINTLNVTGLKWFDTDNGDAVGGYQHTAQQTNLGTSFQKGGGLGNVQALAEQAPLQIGDRVWFDGNRNGIQDADEPPLAGIVVTATRADGTGTPLRTTTDADGAYLFDSRDANPLALHTEYVISFALPDDVDLDALVFPGDPRYGFITWGDLAITTPEAQGGSRAEVDSNPDPATASFTYTTGAGGQNDHSLDAGYFADLTPTATIEKFDGTVGPDGTVTVEGQDADTFDDGATYAPGDTKTIVIRLVNTGPEPLKNVVLTDTTVSGAAITGLRWWLPGETAARAAAWDADADQWRYAWAETSDDDGSGSTGHPETTWAVGAEIIGEATLTIEATDAAPHRDVAAFTADGAYSGNPVAADDPYSAYTGAIQVIKYDGTDPDAAPVWQSDTGSWIVPDKPAFAAGSAAVDANTVDDAVEYAPGAENTVRYVVTNTGPTWLTDLRLDDVTVAGPDIEDWTADLSALVDADGQPLGYPAALAVTTGVAVDDFLFGPGQSFVVTGLLSLGVQEWHHDEVTVTATVVVPAADDDGEPTGAPRTDGEGAPVRAPSPDDPDQPFDVSDDDPFHAFATAFYIQKDARDGSPLAGAAFQLRGDDTSGGGSRPGAVVATPVTAVDGETGRFIVSGLPAGTYWLEETRAPVGHDLLPQAVRLVVAADGTVTVPDAGALVVADTADGISTVVVTDLGARELPLTGATGSTPYVLAGAALLLLGAAVAVTTLLRRRRANAE